MGNKLEKNIIENPENEKKLRSLFKKYDKDKSGSLNDQEFGKMVDEFQKLMVLQNPELKILEYSFEKYEVFEDCDVDGDNSISYTEFKEYLKEGKLKNKLEINHYHSKNDTKNLLKYTDYKLGASDMLKLFFYFAKKNDLEIVLKLVERGLDFIKTTNFQTENLFEYCNSTSIVYNLEIFRLFFNKKADPNFFHTFYNRTPFHTIFNNYNSDLTEIIKLFVEYKGDIFTEISEKKGGLISDSLDDKKASVFEFALHRHQKITPEIIDLFFSFSESPEYLINNIKTHGGPFRCLIYQLEYIENFIPVCKKLIEKGVDINPKEISILHEIIEFRPKYSYSCSEELEKKKLEYIQFFLENKTDPHRVNSKKKNALETLYKNDKYMSVSLVKSFLENKYDPNFVSPEGRSPFPLQIFDSDVFSNNLSEYISLFLEYGFNVNTQSYSKNTISHLFLKHLKYSQETMKKLIEFKADLNIRGGDGDTLLNTYLKLDEKRRKEPLETISFFLQNGVNPDIEDYKKRTPLFYMIEKAIPIQILFEYNVYVNHKDKNSITPLHMACRYKPELIIYLIEMGADATSIDNDGHNALHHLYHATHDKTCIPVGYNDVKILNLLLERKCDPNQIGSNNRTPLFWVCSLNDSTKSVDVIKLFADFGANPTISDINKVNVLDLLGKSGREEVRDCIKLFPF
eukprot:TRINITY_DN1858_c0_g1_i3.p1 TRINITY_DN1858_c0_g1~~TRINITY_DN1858_c0_g1_i3.p1  ORF type:complete len:685 (-),score=147.67 TRINITY_DN1858_c0_g1_i3:15-2069(-)